MVELKKRLSQVKILMLSGTYVTVYVKTNHMLVKKFSSFCKYSTWSIVLLNLSN